MTLKDPFLEGTFWDKFWRPIRSRAFLFTPDMSSLFQNSTLETVVHPFPMLISAAQGQRLQRKQTSDTASLWHFSEEVLGVPLEGHSGLE